MMMSISFSFWTAVFLVALGAAYGGVWLLRGSKFSGALMDHPNDRSSHSVAIPRGGGLAIAAVTLIGLNVLASQLGNTADLLPFSIAAAAVAGVSFWDDLRPLPVQVRLAVHLAAAVGLVFFTGGVSGLASPGTVLLPEGWIGHLVAVLWIVWLTNAFNFMDGIDGIAATQAFLGAFGFVVIGVLYNEPLSLGFGALVAGSSIGFLFHNWAPARMFMGDVGSAFLGFSLAAYPLVLLQKEGPETSDLSIFAVTVVWLFVFDAGLTLLRRLVKRERVWLPHREHFYQRFVAAGWSHGMVATLYGACTAINISVLAIALNIETGIGPLVASSLAATTALLLTIFRCRESFVRRTSVGSTEQAGENE